MVLNSHPIYPSAGRYVLRLQRDVPRQDGQLAGRVEHVTSGDSADFASAAELLAWLSRHAAQVLDPAQDPTDPPLSKDNS